MKCAHLKSTRQNPIGGLEDPFSMATNFQAKLEEEAERRRRGGAPQGDWVTRDGALHPGHKSPGFQGTTYVL